MLLKTNTNFNCFKVTRDRQLQVKCYTSFSIKTPIESEEENCKGYLGWTLMLKDSSDQGFQVFEVSGVSCCAGSGAPFSFTMISQNSEK